jgi:fructuronate reductase
MQPSKKNLSLNAKLQSSDFLHPEFEKNKLIFSTKDSPGWVHFGANDGCMLPAYILQNLLENSEVNFGIILAEAKYYSNIDNIFLPYNNNGICFAKKNKTSIEKKVVSTIVESLKADSSLYPSDWERLVHVFRNPSLQIVSFSLGDNPYAICSTGSTLFPCYEEDCECGPENAHTELGKITALCYERFLAGEYPLALMSFDDCSKNGSRLNEAIVRIAREWEERGIVFSGFSGWLNEPEIIAFPWTKIINTKDTIVSLKYAADTLSDDFLELINKNTPPMLFLDETFRLYMEDDFPNGRLSLEKSGVVFLSRDEILSV